MASPLQGAGGMARFEEYEGADFTSVVACRRESVRAKFVCCGLFAPLLREEAANSRLL